MLSCTSWMYLVRRCVDVTAHCTLTLNREYVCMHFEIACVLHDLNTFQNSIPLFRDRLLTLREVTPCSWPRLLLFLFCVSVHAWHRENDKRNSNKHKHKHDEWHTHTRHDGRLLTFSVLQHTLITIRNMSCERTLHTNWRRFLLFVVVILAVLADVSVLFILHLCAFDTRLTCQKWRYTNAEIIFAFSQ